MPPPKTPKKKVSWAPPTPFTEAQRPPAAPARTKTPDTRPQTATTRAPPTATPTALLEIPRTQTGAGIRKARKRLAGAGRARDPELTAILAASDVAVHAPGDPEYERAVAGSNLLYRFSRPTYVVRPQNISHVSEVVKEACYRKMPITIKDGGHSCSGSSLPNHGIVLDLKDMNKITFDKAAMEMTIEGGALWGDVYRTLVDEEDGLMVNGGRCPSAGVSGVILGGGIGPFSRSFGMAVDSLTEVTIITAPDGDLYTVKAEDDQDSEEGMLFWALCGAGGGNFGVVVEVKIRVHKLSNGGQEVVAGRHTWFPGIERGRGGVFGFTRRAGESTGLLATMNHFYTTNWPDQMTIDTTWFSDLELQNGDIAVRFLACFDGNQDDFSRLVSRGVLDADLSKQLTRRALPEQSSRFLHETLSAQWDEETKRTTPANSTFRVSHSFCFTNERTQIGKITAIVREELEAFKVLFAGEASGLCQVSFIHAGGQAARKSRWATAFRWREAVFHTCIMVQWRDKWLERDMRGFAHRFKNRLRRFSMAGRAALVSLPDASLPATDHLRAYYGNNRQKLRQVKRVWDEHNYFRRDQGIDLAEGDGRAADVSSGTKEEELSDGEEEEEGGPDEQTDLLATLRWESRGSTAAAPLLTLGSETPGLDHGA